MSRYFEKGIQEAREVVASVGAKPEDPSPMTREQVESFIKGFGVSGPGVRRIVEQWMADQQKARDAGWESHADAVYYDEH